MTSVAYFISPHGFGHAARSCAVMEALLEQVPAAHFHLFTGAPEWFFAQSLPPVYTYHPASVDIGLAQNGPLEEDLPETVRRLDGLLPFGPERLAALADDVRALDCRLVICDIAPLGIAVAQAAGLPSLLIENFTWDWIYDGYADAPRLRQQGEYLRGVFAQASAHIQTEPVCRPTPRADLTAPPASRRPRQTREAVRAQLGIPAGAPTILVSMGGIPQPYALADGLAEQPDIFFIIPGGGQQVERRANTVILPHHSEFYHPDLMVASDAVVGKTGYSTTAEAYAAGKPFGYIGRERFRESPVIEAYIQRQMSGFQIPTADFESGAWVAQAPRLLELPHPVRSGPGGAQIIAGWIARHFLRQEG